MKTKIKIAFSVIFLAFPIFTFTNAVVAIGDMSAHKIGSAAVYLLRRSLCLRLWSACMPC